MKESSLLLSGGDLRLFGTLDSLSLSLEFLEHLSSSCLLLDDFILKYSIINNTEKQKRERRAIITPDSVRFFAHLKSGDLPSKD